MKWSLAVIISTVRVTRRTNHCSIAWRSPKRDALEARTFSTTITTKRHNRPVLSTNSLTFIRSQNSLHKKAAAMAPNEARARKHQQLLNSDLFCEAAEQNTYDSNKNYEDPVVECAPVEDGFHELYLQVGGTEYTTFVVFEDGMDFEECELYYASMESQSEGGVLRGSLLGTRKERLSCLRHPQNLSSSNLRSCLRGPKRSAKSRTEESQRQLRRCSFSGQPLQGEVTGPYPLKKSTSSRDLSEHTPRVAFGEFVQVTTIDPAKELPYSVRSQLWMSRKELLQGMRQYALEERERKAKVLTLAMAVEDGPENVLKISTEIAVQ
jgi:hypothetical protein